MFSIIFYLFFFVLLKYVYISTVLFFFFSCLFLYTCFNFCSSFNDLGVLDLALNFPGYHRWKFTDVLRNILKVIIGALWVVILPIFYVSSFKSAPQGVKGLLSFFKQIKGIPAMYMLAVALYMLPNLLAAALFLFPMLRRWIENSDWHIVRFFLWWSQVVMFSVLLNIKCLSWFKLKYSVDDKWFST